MTNIIKHSFLIAGYDWNKKALNKTGINKSGSNKSGSNGSNKTGTSPLSLLIHFYYLI